MPAGLPGSTNAQNLANPSLGGFVIFDPISGPKGSPLDADKQVDIITGTVTARGGCSTGALSTGIGIGDTDIINVSPGTTSSSDAIFKNGFGYHNIAGEQNATYSAPPPNGVVATNAINSTMMYIGGGLCDAAAQGYAAPTPYTAGIALCGAGNGGSRDGGSGPAFTGFPMRMVTASAGVAVGAAVETGYVNRSTRSLVSTESCYGSATAALAAPS